MGEKEAEKEKEKQRVRKAKERERTEMIGMEEADGEGPTVRNQKEERWTKSRNRTKHRQ